MAENIENLEDVLARIRTKTDGQESVSVADLLAAFEDRSFGPLLVVTGLIMLGPVGTIPVLPSAMALLVVLVAGQRAFGRRHPWVPHFLAQRSIARERLVPGLDRMKPWARRMDRLVHPRIPALVRAPMPRVLAILAVLIALWVPTLELIPFAVVVPSLAIIAIGLALLGRDGLLALVAVVFGAASIGLAIWGLWLR